MVTVPCKNGERDDKRRFRLICAALTGLLADHIEHPEQKRGNETCQQTVARLAVEIADEVMIIV